LQNIIKTLTYAYDFVIPTTIWS